MKQKFVLLDNQTNKKFTLGLTNDIITEDITIVFPEKNGKVVVEEDFNSLLENASNANNFKGYTGSQGVQGITGFTGSTGYNGSNGYTGSIGYTGSKGETGQGFNISKIFNTLSELLAGSVNDDTFALVAGTLPQTDPDYGKLYFRKNNSWTYVTDLSVEGAAGIQGPKGDTGATGPQGPNGVSSGAIIVFVGNNTPSGYLKCNGALLSRTTFSSLWAYAQSSGALVSEIEWSSSNQGCFSTGDGSTTFRIPDLRGEFIRGWDDGRGIDTNRTIGSKQEATSIGSAVQLSHDVILKNTDGTDGTYSVTGDANPQASYGGTYHKVRPRNIAMMYCIKY